MNIPDETAVYLDFTGLFEGIDSHHFDENEPLTLENGQPLKIQIGNSQNAKNIQDLPLSVLYNHSIREKKETNKIMILLFHLISFCAYNSYPV